MIQNARPQTPESMCRGSFVGWEIYSCSDIRQNKQRSGEARNPPLVDSNCLNSRKWNCIVGRERFWTFPMTRGGEREKREVQQQQTPNSLLAPRNASSWDRRGYSKMLSWPPWLSLWYENLQKGKIEQAQNRQIGRKIQMDHEHWQNVVSCEARIETEEYMRLPDNHRRTSLNETANWSCRWRLAV